MTISTKRKLNRRQCLTEGRFNLGSMRSFAGALAVVALLLAGCDDGSKASGGGRFSVAEDTSGDDSQPAATATPSPTAMPAVPEPPQHEEPTAAATEETGAPPSPTAPPNAATLAPTRPPATHPVPCSCECTGYCGEVDDPVCGVDGRTYRNACDAEALRVHYLRGACPDPTPTPTPRTPDELPDVIDFPGCEAVTAEDHYCLTLSGGEVSLLGIDSGRTCAVTTTDAPVHDLFLVSGSIAWLDDDVYVCGEEGLIRISLSDGSWQVGGGPCNGVASYDDGLLVNRWFVNVVDPHGDWWDASPLAWYPDYEAVLNDEPERTFGLGGWAATMTVQGEKLYTAWHAGVSIEVGNLGNDEALGVLTLEDYNGWMLGMSVTSDGYLILSGDEGVYVFDAYGGSLVKKLGTRASGLACATNDFVPLRDTPTPTPNLHAPSSSTPCTAWLDCPDSCTGLESDPRPFRPHELPPSMPIEMNCLGGYGSSNYALPEASLVSEATEELHVIGVYEGRGNPGFREHAQGVVDVTVHARPKPIVLALTSYEGILWRLTLEPGATLSRVILQGYYPQEVEGVPEGVPVIHRGPEESCGSAYGWEVASNSGGGQFDSMMASLRRFTGLVETSFQGCYSGDRFEIPYWSGEPPSGTPTPVAGDEDLPREEVAFAACDGVTAESEYCVTAGSGSIAVIGLDSGEVCQVTGPSTSYLGFDVSSLSWRGEIVYTCSYDQGLVRTSLRDGSSQAMQAGCQAVTDYGGGLLLSDMFFQQLALYPSLAAVLDGQPSATYSFGGGYSRMTTGGDTFYGAWHSTNEIVVGDLTSGETLPPLPLEGFDGWVNGMAVASTGELVLVAGSDSGPWTSALLFFDPTTGARVRTLPVAGWLEGLSCVATGQRG